MLTQIYLHTWTFGEWVYSLLLQKGHHNISVDFERQNRQKGCQRAICHHTYERIIAYRNQGDQNGSKDYSGLDGILPKVGFFKPHDELHVVGEKEKKYWIILRNFL